MTLNTEIALQPEPSNRPARRRKARDQRIRRFKRTVIATAPHLDDPRYGPIVSSFARASLMVIDSTDFLRERGIVGADGELRSSVDTLNRLMGTQLKLANALGLVPGALGKLRNEKPIDLAAVFAAQTDNGD